MSIRLIIAVVGIVLLGCGGGSEAPLEDSHDAEVGESPLEEQIWLVLGFSRAEVVEALTAARFEAVRACVEESGWQASESDLPRNPPDVPIEPNGSALLSNVNAYLAALRTKPEWASEAEEGPQDSEFRNILSICSQTAIDLFPDPLERFNRWLENELRSLYDAVAVDERVVRAEHDAIGCSEQLGFDRETLGALNEQLQTRADEIYDEYFFGRASRSEAIDYLLGLLQEAEAHEIPLADCRRAYDSNLRAVRFEYEEAFLELHGDAIKEQAVSARKGLDGLLVYLESGR